MDVTHTMDDAEAVAHRPFTGMHRAVQEGVFQSGAAADVCRRLLEKPARVVLPAPVLQCTRCECLSLAF